MIPERPHILHCTRAFKLKQHARLAILPGEHGEYMGEITTVKGHNEYPALPIIETFLNETVRQ